MTKSQPPSYYSKGSWNSKMNSKIEELILLSYKYSKKLYQPNSMTLSKPIKLKVKNLSSTFYQKHPINLMDLSIRWKSKRSKKISYQKKFSRTLMLSNSALEHCRLIIWSLSWTTSLEMISSGKWPRKRSSKENWTGLLFCRLRTRSLIFRVRRPKHYVTWKP